jgi:uncharacterized protein YdhG (YjbR/CyaY superfamily)
MDMEIKTIDEYLANVDAPKKAALEHIRKLVHQVVPEAEESISYGMPAFKYKGKPLIYFAAFADHLSIFPTSTPIAELKDKLEEFKTGKGTIQFTLEKPVPDALIKELLAVRVADIS